MSKMLLAIILVLLIALTLSWASPITHAFEPRDYSVQGGHLEPWTIDRGINFLEYAQSTHHYYSAYPEDCNKTTGDAEFNRKLVSEYQQIIDLLKEVKGGNHDHKRRQYYIINTEADRGSFGCL